MRRQVLLPQPEGPTRTRNSLSLTSRLMSWTTSTLPKRLNTCSNRTRAITATPFALLTENRPSTREVILSQGYPQLLWINLQTAIEQDMNFCGVRSAAAEVAPFVPLSPRDEGESAGTIANQFASVVGAGGIGDERLVGKWAVGSSQLAGNQVVRARPICGPRVRQPRGSVPGCAEKQVVPAVQRYDLWDLHLSEVTWHAHRWQHLP